MDRLVLFSKGIFMPLWDKIAQRDEEGPLETRCPLAWPVQQRPQIDVGCIKIQYSAEKKSHKKCSYN